MKRTEEYGLMVGDEPFGRTWPEEQFDPVFDIEQFHRKFHQFYDGPPRDLPVDMQEFRLGFKHEELREYNEEGVIPGDRAKQLDAMVDLVYVVLGTCHLNGFDFREAWRRVHRANMGKVIANPEGDDRSHRNTKFDIVKPEGWLPPNHDDLVK